MKTICPNCGKPAVSRVAIHYQKITSLDGDAADKIVIKNVEITETISFETIVKNIIQSLNNSSKNIISNEELNYILKNTFGITKNSISDVINLLVEEHYLNFQGTENVFVVI